MHVRGLEDRLAYSEALPGIYCDDDWVACLAREGFGIPANVSLVRNFAASVARHGHRCDVESLCDTIGTGPPYCDSDGVALTDVSGRISVYGEWHAHRLLAHRGRTTTPLLDHPRVAYRFFTYPPRTFLRLTVLPSWVVEVANPDGVVFLDVQLAVSRSVMRPFSIDDLLDLVDIDADALRAKMGRNTQTMGAPATLREIKTRGDLIAWAEADVCAVSLTGTVDICMCLKMSMQP